MFLRVFLGIIIQSFCHAADGASILALFSSLSFADHLVFRGYITQLAERGHSVVVMTAYPGHFSYPAADNIVELDVGTESAPFWEDYKNLMTNVDDYFTKMREINELLTKIAIAQLKSKQMTAFFMNPQVKVDLVITEAEMPILYAVADKYRVPHIAITTGSGTVTMYESKANPNHPLLYPDVNTLNYRNLNVVEKVTEMSRYFQTKHEYYNTHLPVCRVAAEKILGLKRSLLEVEYDIDLLIVTGNPILIGNRPTVPAIVYSDRLHIKPGLKLAPGLKDVLDSAKNGAVYFSLGALQDCEQLSNYTLQILANTFRELPFTVLWKIGNTSMINVPKNVVVRSWFPQQEILAHPNVKVFVTHGGPRSLEEAVYYEVPIVGFPILKPRKVFIQEITKFGAGEILDPYFLNADTLKQTILLVASNDKYSKAMSHVKDLTEDPLISAPENAIWWTNYVIRHKGAVHLRSPVVGLSFIRYFMLDVVGTVLGSILAFILVTYMVVRYLRRRLRAHLYCIPEDSSKYKAL